MGDNPARKGTSAVDADYSPYSAWGANASRTCSARAIDSAGSTSGEPIRGSKFRSTKTSLTPWPARG